MNDSNFFGSRLCNEQFLRRRDLHADGTTMQVLQEPEQAAQTKAHAWLHSTGRDGQSIVAYDSEETRFTEHPQQFPENLAVVGAFWQGFQRKGSKFCPRESLDRTLWKPRRRMDPNRWCTCMTCLTVLKRRPWGLSGTQCRGSPVNHPDGGCPSRSENWP
ncbi:IS66 family transposase [Alicyclobacillus shizuokensis]|uniref:IS66 family transposase n=1 Tax=Alicyclobacillus shizuokensis TaxID=392014 RepID=UPI0009F9C306|nr:IS66 family transposase [Alicyclobacillus shizuokensis]